MVRVPNCRTMMVVATILLAPLVGAACGSHREGAEEEALQDAGPMFDDEAAGQVEAVFTKGGIGIFTFDETKPGCLVDPTTMPASVFSSCTGEVGLPARVTHDLAEFDPSHALEMVYAVPALALDGKMRWFGIVGLGPSEHLANKSGAADLLSPHHASFRSTSRRARLAR